MFIPRYRYIYPEVQTHCSYKEETLCMENHFEQRQHYQHHHHHHHQRGGLRLEPPRVRFRPAPTQCLEYSRAREETR